MARLKTGRLHEAVGCKECVATGFRGRSGIFELLQVSETVQSMVISRRPSQEIKKQAIAEGMCTLRDDGWTKVLEGVTTVQEVMRATEENT
jgi:type II secretory ATPase GspE/PulE/Tfp pilus assembly ATPase PilB-like protein